MTIRKPRSALAMALVVGLMPSIARAQTYTFFEAYYNPYNPTTPTGINDAGYVSGYNINNALPGYQGFVRSPSGTLTPLVYTNPINGQGVQNILTGINNNGITVGLMESSYEDPFYYNGSVNFMNPIAGPPGTGVSSYFPGGCNNNGAQYVGYMNVSGSGFSNNYAGFIYNETSASGVSFVVPSTIVPAPDTTSGPYHTKATAINASGTVLGFYKAVGGTYGFLYTGGTTFQSFSIPGYTFDFTESGYGSVPWGINDSGVIVGGVSSGSAQHSFILQPNGTFVVFDPTGTTSSAARAINNNGVVVGTSNNYGGSAYIRSPSGPAIKSIIATGRVELATQPVSRNPLGLKFPNRSPAPAKSRLVIK